MGQMVSTVSKIAPVLSAGGSFLGTLPTLFNAIGVGASSGSDDDRRRALRASQDLALKQLQEKQAQAFQSAQQDAALNREKILSDAQAAEQTRLAALRRAMARQKSQFGASGISAADGSAEAVLLGLFQESDDERGQREKLDNLRNLALEEDLSAQKRLNVLQRSQLAERQRLERITEGF